MGQILYSRATTTEAIRRAIQNSEESLKALAKRHGIDQKTVAKWKKRETVSDLLVIATPIWNFGILSAIKAWIDLVVRPGRTFQYTDDGVVTLAKGRKAILILASGGVFTDGPWRPWDFVEPYLRQILGFIGIVDVQTIRIEGMNIPALAPDAVPKANNAVEELAL